MAAYSADHTQQSQTTETSTRQEEDEGLASSDESSIQKKQCMATSVWTAETMTVGLSEQGIATSAAQRGVQQQQGPDTAMGQYNSTKASQD